MADVACEGALGHHASVFEENCKTVRTVQSADVIPFFGMINST
jgi:hypothetical protein